MSIYTAVISELDAANAAVFSGYEPCIKFHYKRAVGKGISHEDFASAITNAPKVKEVRHVMSLMLPGW